MAASRKKVLLRTSENVVHAGYLPLSGFVQMLDGVATVELLDLDGRLAPVALAQTQTICYVRDFNLDDKDAPERLTRRTFMARPRAEGLWLRLTLTEAEPLEGLAPLDVSLLDGLLRDRGLFLLPPDMRSNTQRVFVPRTAIAELQVLGAIGAVPPKAPTPARRESAGPSLPFPTS